MAIINVDDAYILNETGAQVDKTTGIPFKNESLTEAEAAQARANIRAGGSNPNLLDNAYFVGGGSQLGDGVFPINQRGQASYGQGYGVDRWAADTSVSLTSTGIVVSTNAFYQNGELSILQFLLGKTCTASVLYADGEIVSGTATFPSTLSGTQFITYKQDEIYSVLFSGGNGQIFRVIPNGRTIAAVKLEVGTVSTLANDVPPDFGEELRKCQRYLRYVSLKRLPVFCDANYLVAMTTLEGIEMRATPTPTLVSAGYIFNPATSATSVPTAVSILAFEYNTATIQLSIPASFNGFCIAVDSAICLSAEL